MSDIEKRLRDGFEARLASVDFFPEQNCDDPDEAAKLAPFQEITFRVPKTMAMAAGTYEIKLIR